MSGLDTPSPRSGSWNGRPRSTPHRLAVVDGDRRLTWAQFADEVTTLARALQGSGVRTGDRVAFLWTNSAQLLAAHFAVPLAHAVLVAINTRLSPAEVAYICEHSAASLLLGDGDLLAALEPLPSGTEIVEVPARTGRTGTWRARRATRTSSPAARPSRCRGRSTTRRGRSQSTTRVTVPTAGAPPSPTIITRVRDLGARLVHVYGLTETYGPCAVCEPADTWADLPDDEQARLLARQGVGMLTSDRVRVVRREPDATGELTDVAPDGAEMGEIVMRGNSVMKGYHRDPSATAEAFAGGWFHSGDLGVRHPDGYVQLLDRAKDVIISGGENISTVEVEQALLSHPEVVDVAVIGVPDERWGERPKAFVVLSAGAATATEEDLVEHVRDRIARYKAPREVEIVAELPRTSTGKVRKNELRDAAWSHTPIRIGG